MEIDVRKHKRNLGKRTTIVRKHSRSLANPNYNPKQRTPFKPTAGRRLVDYNWKQSKKRFPNMNPKGDIDGDNVLNKNDCKPFDKTRHSDLLMKDIEEVFAEPRVITTAAGKKMNVNFPTREELEEEMEGNYGESVPPKEEVIIIDKKHLKRVLQKNPDLITPLKETGTKIQFKNTFDAVHSRIEDDSPIPRRSLATFRPAFKEIEVNPIGHKDSEFTPEDTVRHEIEHVKQSESGKLNPSNIDENEEEAYGILENLSPRETAKKGGPKTEVLSDWDWEDD